MITITGLISLCLGLGSMLATLIMEIKRDNTKYTTVIVLCCGIVLMVVSIVIILLTVLTFLKL